MSKSKAIRALLTKQPDISPTEASIVLAKKGLDVSPAFVSNIKTKWKKRASENEPSEKPAMPAVPAVRLDGAGGELVTATEILQCLSYVRACDDSVSRARFVLEHVAKHLS